MEGGIELQLYVATPSFADTQQYLDSELLLATINAHELKKRVKVDRLDNLWEHEDFFDCINDPGQETKLPFLVRIYNDETGIVLGHSGLENIADVLNSLYSLEVTIYDTKTGNTSTYYPNQQH